MNITIRLAVAADAPDMAEIHARSWEAAYKDILPPDCIEKQSAKRPDQWRGILASENNAHYIIYLDKTPVGMLTVGPLRREDIENDIGTDDTYYELHGIYLHPAYLRRGIGSRAMEFAFGKAREAGKTNILVWVFADNRGAIGFYESFGFAADGASKTFYSKKVIRMRTALPDICMSKEDIGMDHTARLSELQEKIYRKRRISSMLETLYKRRGELAENELALREARSKEQADVDRLEGKSLSAFFFSITGRRDEKLKKEQAEAMAAAVKHDAAAAELADVSGQIERLEAESRDIGDCEREYDKAFSEKKEWLKTLNNSAAEELCSLEEAVGRLKNQLKEIDEAVSAGRKSLNTKPCKCQ